MPIIDTPEARYAAHTRLTYYRSVLQQLGIQRLSGLGELHLTGAVAAQPGIVMPQGRPMPVLPPLPASGRLPLLPLERRPVGVALPVQDVLVPRFVEAVVPQTWTPLLSTARSLVLDRAYFVAERIVLADDSTIVLLQPHRFLTFIAEEMVVGRNVTFTYERPQAATPVMSWPPGSRPPNPGKAPTPNDVWGENGGPGLRGADGGRGWQGVDAPELELWLLRMTGSPIFDLQGQQGGPGGRGQDGGQGGEGSDGRAELYDWLGFCRSGAGAGGDGGRGGDGGNGGSGGNGGHGGRLGLYAPAPVLQTYAAGGFTVNIAGGSSGTGGMPGAPGPGGAGGRLGARPKNCSMSEERHDGAAGAQGAQGSPGASGAQGETHDDAVRLVPVEEDDFQRQLTAPALIRAVPSRGAAGTPVTVEALRLTEDDDLYLDGQQIPMTVVADTAATFTVPAAQGGARVLTVRRADGTASNPLSFYVMPSVTQVGDGAAHIRPGSTVTVSGTGFAPGARVRVLGEDMPDVAYLSPSSLTFRLLRPQATPEAADGEPASLQVVLADGTPSNPVGFIIDTLRMVVLGDSVAWGQGLQPHQKYATLVREALAARSGGIRAYATMLAHSGAIIGVGDTTSLPALPGEVPNSYPTALQQLASYSGSPDSVDYVLVTAGLNDIDIRTILNPLNKPKDFAPAIARHCHDDLRTLLAAAAGRFPNARIVATAYYPMLSDASDTSGLGAFLVAAGLTVAGLPGGSLAPWLIPQVVTNCRALNELSRLAIAAAVDDVNDTLAAPRVLFADPGFTEQNAALAPEPWVYAINADLTPQDPIVAAERGPQCEMSSAPANMFVCRRASIGHPNPAGARAYADAIMRVLDQGDPRDAPLPPLPPGFLWGVATAAMQNEGDLAGNDWAAFVSSPAIQRRVRRLGEIEGAPIELTEPGPAVRHGDPAVLASDLDRARDLGLTAYRFSVEWSRIQPQPAGHTGPLTAADLDPAALAYYDRVLDDLEARGLTPVLSLNHLTLPLWVLSPPRESGIGSIVKLPFASGDDPDFKASLRGWENPETVTAFVEFVRFLAARWSERVRWWVTLNEPVGSMIGVGYLAGIWPPGFTGDGARGRDAYFNLIRAHCQAYAVLKAADPNAMVGIAHAMMHAKVTTAATDTLLGDQEAARNQFDYFYNWHILNAVIDGQVDLAIARRAPDRDLVPPDELGPWLGVDLGSPAAWRTHCDFIGLNYYRSVYVYADALVSGFIGYSGGRFKNDLREADQPHVLLNDLGWEISPGGFGDALRSLHNRYGLPVLVTENGVPQSSDRQRGPFITAHLEELSRAVAEGVDVRGYLYWTLIDNWEWHEGYRPEARFGLFTVDRDDPAMPRHLTEGAHALTYAIGNGDLNGAKELFGTITSAGDRVRPPRQSTALYTGTLAGLPVKLWLRTAPQGRVHAVLHDGERAIAGTGRIETALGSITLQFAAASGLPGAVLTARNGGSPGLLGGSLDHDGKSLPFAAAKDTLVGQWTSSSALLPRLAIVARPDASAWSGLWLPDRWPRQWEPLSVTRTPSSIRVDAGAFRVSATLSQDQLTGQLTQTGTTVAWTARRLPDQVDL